MSDDMQLALLTSDDLSWLASGELSPISPLAPFAGLTETSPQQSPRVTGFNDTGWEWAKSVLREPAARIRVLIPGSTHSLVQYFYGDGLPGRGMVGCWLEDDGLRVSFPWSNQDIASLTSQVLFQEPPESVDIDPVVLSADGLTALAAAVDAVRAQRFAGEATEGPLREYRFGQDSLDARLSAGTESTDALWLVSLFQMTGFGAGVGGGALDRGLGELHAAGFVSIEGDHWTPRPTLLSYASWWANPLPAVSYETTGFEGGSAVHHEHRIVIRGEGPLVTFHKDGGSPDGSPITVSAPSSLEYFDDLARAFERVAPDEPEWVHVLEPVEVRDLVDTMTVVAHLQPGQWYLLMDMEGPWARVSDPNGTVEGWAPAEELLMDGEPQEEVPSEPAPVRSDPPKPDVAVVPPEPDVAVVPQPVSSGGKGWRITGITAFALAAAFWMLILVGLASDPSDIGELLVGGVIVTAIPIGIGIFALVRAARAGTSGPSDPPQQRSLSNREQPAAQIADSDEASDGLTPAGSLRTSEGPPEERSHDESEREPIAPTWAASHVVPTGGMRSWAVPDGTTEPLADLAGGVELEVVERRTDWARVRAENGWEAWVDGRLLASVPTHEPPPLPPLTEDAPSQ